MAAAKPRPRGRRGVAHLPSRLRDAIATQQRAQPMKQLDVEYLDLNCLELSRSGYLDPKLGIPIRHPK
jgi:hypothetical protein